MINEHETDQLYVCTLCKFTFKYLNELKQHRHDYHGDKYGRQTLKKLDPDQEIQCMEVSGDETDYLVEEDL